MKQSIKNSNGQKCQKFVNVKNMSSSKTNQNGQQQQYSKCKKTSKLLIHKNKRVQNFKTVNI